MSKYVRDIAHCKHDTKEDIAVITNNQTIIASGTNEWVTSGFEIDYPTGFNSDNCVVLAIGKSVDLANWNEYNYGEDGNYNWVEVSATLGTKITIHVSNKKLEDFDLYYKIVLMKLS